MREKEKERENSRLVILLLPKKVSPSIHNLGLIYAQRRAKLQKYLNYLQYRKGILGKITKTWSKRGLTGQKLESRLQFSHPAKISHLAQFSQASISLPLLLFFPSDFQSAMLSSTRILRAWIDSTNLV